MRQLDHMDRYTAEGRGPRKPSREEIETLCLLYVIDRDGCRLSRLAQSLGLSSSLEPVMDDAIEPLVLAGWVERQDDEIFVTQEGREWVLTRLDELGVSRGPSNSTIEAGH